MDKLRTDDLLSLERYHQERSRMRAEVLAHKRHRQAPLGPNLSLYFEDRLTMQYQIQEMLRDGTNLKATMMLEYPDAAERRTALERLTGVENAVYLEVGTLGRVFAYADEDLARSDETKTSAVHFLRFELDAARCAALKNGAALKLGVDHEHYRHELDGSAELRKALTADLD